MSSLYGPTQVEKMKVEFFNCWQVQFYGFLHNCHPVAVDISRCKFLTNPPFRGLSRVTG
jgi:hypothetical protein